MKSITLLSAAIAATFLASCKEDPHAKREEEAVARLQEIKLKYGIDRQETPEVDRLRSLFAEKSPETVSAPGEVQKDLAWAVSQIEDLRGALAVEQEKAYREGVQVAARAIKQGLDPEIILEELEKQ